jgi:hypothetical protein
VARVASGTGSRAPGQGPHWVTSGTVQIEHLDSACTPIADMSVGIADGQLSAKGDFPIRHSGAITAGGTVFGIHDRGLQGLDGRWLRWRICLAVVAAAEPTDVKP